MCERECVCESVCEREIERECDGGSPSKLARTKKPAIKIILDQLQRSLQLIPTGSKLWQLLLLCRMLQKSVPEKIFFSLQTEFFHRNYSHG